MFHSKSISRTSCLPFSISPPGHRVRICDMQQVFYFLNMGLSYIEMEWPSQELYALAGKTGWGRPNRDDKDDAVSTPTASSAQPEQPQPQQQDQQITPPTNNDWEPKCGTEGVVIHRWVPNHSDSRFRTNYSMPILLIECEEDGNSFYVPVGESGAVDLGAEV